MKRITLADRFDTYNFHLSQPVCHDFTPRWRRVLRKVFWWRYPPSIVTHIDREAGVITVQALRWSWRKWGWL